jgi:hypothetical protein
MASFTNVNEENIRSPDPSQRMQLIDSNNCVYNYDLSEYSENELYRNAIENSISNYYAKHNTSKKLNLKIKL